MDEIIFKGDSQTDSQTFILRQTTLTIAGRPGRENECAIRLSDVSPEFEILRKRFKRFYLVPFFLACLSGALALKLFAGDVSFGVGIVAGIIGCMSPVFLFSMRFAPVEVIRFSDTRGQVIFEVHRPKKGALRYNEFIAALVSRIKMQGTKPSAAKEPS